MAKLQSFFKLVKLFWSHGDNLLRLFDLMLNQLPVIGKSLENAGNLAILTGQAIRGGNGLPPGAAQIIAAAADAVDQCGKKFQDIPEEIGQVKGALHDLNLPSVSIEDVDYPILGGVGHVTIPTPTRSNWYPLRGIESFLEEQSTLVDAAAGQLATARQQLDLLSNNITGAGNHLVQVGKDLKEAGQLFMEIH